MESTLGTPDRRGQGSKPECVAEEWFRHAQYGTLVPVGWVEAARPTGLEPYALDLAELYHS